MSHITHHKKRLLGRVNRLVGQLEGVRRMIEEAAAGDDLSCYQVMQQLAAARGALNSLMSQLIEEHLQHHVADAPTEKTRKEGTDELIKVLRSFAK